MDDGFIFEIKIESVYKKPALVRISDNASNINIENIGVLIRIEIL